MFKLVIEFTALKIKISLRAIKPDFLRVVLSGHYTSLGE